MEWMILPLRRYAQFSGRSQRKEYWMFILLSFIVSIVLSLIDTSLGLGGRTTDFAGRGANGFSAGAYTRGGVLSSIWSLVILVPSLAVSVRRLHDIDRTGWWMLGIFGLFVCGAVLLFAVPIAGGLLVAAGGVMSIVLLVWFCLDGTRGANRFGMDPKGHTADLQETFN